MHLRLKISIFHSMSLWDMQYVGCLICLFSFVFTFSNVTRSMDFTIALLQRLEEDSDQKCFAQLVESAYMVTLKPWHGWISSAAYKVRVYWILGHRFCRKWSILGSIALGWHNSDKRGEQIAMKLIPDRKMFINLLVGKCQDCAALKEEIRKLAKLLKPFLDDIHAMMVSSSALHWFWIHLAKIKGFLSVNLYSICSFFRRSSDWTGWNQLDGKPINCRCNMWMWIRGIRPWSAGLAVYRSPSPFFFFCGSTVVVV